MEFIKIIGRAVGQAAEALGQKHRKTALLNRIRTVIRCEERAAEKEYLALGRYYYNALRDKTNPVAEPHCVALDQIEKRLDDALGAMQAMADEHFLGCTRPESSTIGVIGGWDADEDGPCPPTEGEYEEIDLSDVEVYDADPSLKAGITIEPDKDAPEETTSLPFEG